MLRANVGISRKTSKDYNSTGFSVNLDAEINATLDDPESVIERVKELYSLAEEALDRQVSESREIDAFARRDAEDHPDHNNGRGPGSHPDGPEDPTPARNGRLRDSRTDSPEPATNKQVQFLTTLAKRRKLFGAKLEGFIEETIGRRCTPYELTKKEAGRVIETLNPEGAADNRIRR